MSQCQEYTCNAILFSSSQYKSSPFWSRFLLVALTSHGELDRNTRKRHLHGAELDVKSAVWKMNHFLLMSLSEEDMDGAGEEFRK